VFARTKVAASIFNRLLQHHGVQKQYTAVVKKAKQRQQCDGGNKAVAAASALTSQPLAAPTRTSTLAPTLAPTPTPTPALALAPTQTLTQTPTQTLSETLAPEKLPRSEPKSKVTPFAAAGADAQVSIGDQDGSSGVAGTDAQVSIGDQDGSSGVAGRGSCSVCGSNCVVNADGSSVLDHLPPPGTLLHHFMANAKRAPQPISTHCKGDFSRDAKLVILSVDAVKVNSVQKSGGGDGGVGDDGSVQADSGGSPEGGASGGSGTSSPRVVTVNLITGRTHQIRAQFGACGIFFFAAFGGFDPSLLTGTRTYSPDNSQEILISQMRLRWVSWPI
jgi:hypothetical protein